jgi:hypothetical protein
VTAAAHQVVADVRPYDSSDSSIDWQPTVDGFWSITHTPSGAEIRAVMLNALALDDLANDLRFIAWATELLGVDDETEAKELERRLHVSDLVADEELRAMVNTRRLPVNPILWRIPVTGGHAILFSRSRVWVVLTAPDNQPATGLAA